MNMAYFYHQQQALRELVNFINFHYHKALKKDYWTLKYPAFAMTQPFADGANAQGNLTSLMKNTAFVDTVKNLFQFKHSGISTDHTNSYVQQAIRFLLGTSNTKPVYPSGFADSAKGE
jgi:hypothetical protein